MWIWAALGLIVLAGCEGCGGEEQASQTATPTTESASSSTGGEAAGAEGAADPGPPPDVTVRTEVDRYGRLTLAVENRGSEPARLSSALVAERRDGDSWTAVPNTGLALKVDCDADAPECLTLAPGAVLYPCDCGGCEALNDEHRFTARSCASP